MNPRGVYDRSEAAPRTPRNNNVDPNSLTAKLDACKALARKADRLEAKAKKVRKQSDRLAVEAGEARDELGAKMRELMQS